MFDRLIVYAVIAVGVAVAIGAYGEHRYYTGIAAERMKWNAKIEETNRLTARAEAEATAVRDVAASGRSSIASDILSRPLPRLSLEIANQCSYHADDLAALNRITR